MTSTRMLPRIAIVTLVSLAGTLALYGPASAAPAPARGPHPTFLLSPNVGPPGTVFDARGTGFPPSDSIFLFVGHIQITTLTADGAGNFEMTGLRADSKPGRETFRVTDGELGLTLKATFTVYPNRALPPGVSRP